MQFRPKFVAVLRQLAAEVIQNAKGTNNVLFCDQAGDGSNGCTPVSEALRSKDPGDCTCNGCQDGVVLIFDHAEDAILKPKPCRNHRTMVEARMTVPARLMKDQPRSQVARRTLPHAGTW